LATKPKKHGKLRALVKLVAAFFAAIGIVTFAGLFVPDPWGLLFVNAAIVWGIFSGWVMANALAAMALTAIVLVVGFVVVLKAGNRINRAILRRHGENVAAAEPVIIRDRPDYGYVPPAPPTPTQPEVKQPATAE